MKSLELSTLTQYTAVIAFLWDRQLGRFDWILRASRRWERKMSVSHLPGAMTTFQLSYLPVKIHFTGGLDWRPLWLPTTIDSIPTGLSSSQQPLRYGSLLPENQETKKGVTVSFFYSCALGPRCPVGYMHCPQSYEVHLLSGSHSLKINQPANQPSQGLI